MILHLEFHDWRCLLVVINFLGFLFFQDSDEIGMVSIGDGNAISGYSIMGRFLVDVLL
jgi:hypothetical protein